MTKNVRIENADNNMAVKVIVEVWNKQIADGDTVNYISKTEELKYPTTLNNYLIHDGQWLVIREEKNSLPV